MFRLFEGRGGKAVTLVTQFDIRLVHAIESFISKYSKFLAQFRRTPLLKLSGLPYEEKAVSLYEV